MLVERWAWGHTNQFGELDEECDSDQSKFADEERKYEEVLRIKIEIKGKDHTDVATARCNLGIIYEKQSRCVDAMREYEETLRFRMATLGEDQLDVAATRNNIARALLEAIQVRRCPAGV